MVISATMREKADGGKWPPGHTCKWVRLLGCPVTFKWYCTRVEAFIAHINQVVMTVWRGVRSFLRMTVIINQRCDPYFIWNYVTCVYTLKVDPFFIKLRSCDGKKTLLPFGCLVYKFWIKLLFPATWVKSYNTIKSITCHYFRLLLFPRGTGTIMSATAGGRSRLAQVWAWVFSHRKVDISLLLYNFALRYCLGSGYKYFIWFILSSWDLVMIFWSWHVTYSTNITTHKIVFDFP